MRVGWLRFHLVELHFIQSSFDVLLIVKTRRAAEPLEVFLSVVSTSLAHEQPLVGEFAMR